MGTKNSLYKIIFFVSLATIVLASFVIYRNIFVSTEEVNYTPPNAQVQIATSTQVTGIYSDISEKDFVTFASTTIEKRCPFYVPDGASYRECLATWVDELQQGRATESDINAINLYCETFTKNYQSQQSLAASELFIKCTIFKLTNLFK